MKKVVLFFCLVCMATFVAGNAAADDLKGRFGVTGRLGFLVPSDSEVDYPDGKHVAETSTAFIGGGGFIYGVDNNIALELDVTHTEFDMKSGGVKLGTVETNNLSIGAQYRFPKNSDVVPYVGAGVDVLVNDFSAGSADTVFGLHLSGGLDYFITREFALTGELKGLAAFDADINRTVGTKINYDPSSIAGTFGVRVFFN